MLCTGKIGVVGSWWLKARKGKCLILAGLLSQLWSTEWEAPANGWDSDVIYWAEPQKTKWSPKSLSFCRPRTFDRWFQTVWLFHLPKTKHKMTLLLEARNGEGDGFWRFGCFGNRQLSKFHATCFGKAQSWQPAGKLQKRRLRRRSHVLRFSFGAACSRWPSKPSNTSKNPRL